MSIDRSTKPCCDSNCFASNAVTEGHHPCKYCSGFMHIMCSVPYPGDDEGFGQRCICSDCQQDKHTNISHSIAIPTESEILTSSSSSSLSSQSNANSTSSSTKKTSTNKINKQPIKKKLPTNLKSRDASTIHFNKLILQQIKNDGNLTYAIQLSKGGVGNYFDNNFV